MQTLIFPGYSKTNQAWVDEVSENLMVEGTIRPFRWMHWSDDISHFDPQEKAELIVKHIRVGEVKILAKSIGVLVASKVIDLVPDQVKKAVFCGIPKNDLNDIDFELITKVCQKYKDKITIIQNINDPHGNFEDVKYLGKVIPKDSSNHNYPYYEDFNRILR